MACRILATNRIASGLCLLGLLLVAACGDDDPAVASTEAGPAGTTAAERSSHFGEQSAGPMLNIDIAHACDHYDDPPRQLTASAEELGAVPVMDSTHVLFAVTLPDGHEEGGSAWLDIRVRRAGNIALFSDQIPSEVRLYGPDGTTVEPIAERTTVPSCAAIGWYIVWPLMAGTYALELVYDAGIREVGLLLEEV